MKIECTEREKKVLETILADSNRCLFISGCPKDTHDCKECVRLRIEFAVKEG